MNLVEGIADRRRVTEAVASVEGPTDPTDYNVILVVIDDIGTEWFEWMGVGEMYGTDFENTGYAYTPFLSECVDAGLWFDRATSETTCGPTRETIQSGQYPHRTGFTFNMRDPTAALGTSYLDFGFTVPASTTFLAELLRSERPEIETYHGGKWHMCDAYSSQVPNSGPDNPPNVNLTDPEKYGYQVSKGNMANIGGKYSWWKTENGVNTYIGDDLAFSEIQYPSAVNAADAIAWINGRTGPFFAYIAFGPPHSVYSIPPHTMLSAETNAELTALGLEAGDAVASPNVRSSATGLATWKASMEATDKAIRRIWESMPVARRARTYLIVTGDNGTVAGANPAGFEHVKRELYWGGTRVPMLIRGPGVARPGRVAKQVVHTADIYATVCDLMRVERPTQNGEYTAGQDSVSMLPIIHDECDREDRNALRSNAVVQTAQPVTADPSEWIASQRRRGIFDGRWRFLDQAGVESLYDEDSDPLEETDVIDLFPEEATRLRALLNAQVAV